MASSKDGSTVAIGSPGIIIFQFVENSWKQKRADISRTENDSTFGYRVGLSSDGNALAIAAPDYDTNVGAVHVYDWDSTKCDEGMTVAKGTSSNQHLGMLGVVIEPST